MRLTQEQHDAMDAITRFIDDDWDSSQWAMTLGGYAGTGKTTVISTLAERMPLRQVAYTAPTHKAVAVMAGMGTPDAEYRTIHSLLGLRPSYSNGKTTLKKVASSSLSRYDLVIVDECSMVGLELFAHIKRAAAECRVKFLFMGDPAQLPPVGESISPTFGLPSVMLETVMRQRGDHPALAFCTDIREAWKSGQLTMPSPVAAYSDENMTGLHIMQGELFTQLMPSAFVESDFSDRPDRFRVVAWRNERVDMYNAMIQRLRYPDIGDQPFAAGEQVVFSEPVMARSVTGCETSPSSEPVVNNETAGRVASRPVRREHPVYPDIPAWQVSVMTDEGIEDYWTLAGDGKRFHRMALKIIERQIRAPVATDSKKSWHDYYTLKEAFAVMRPAYAMTAHKSQGSTFENVFVDAVDILSNPNRHEALQCLYVACSRVTHNLIINAV